MDSAIDAASDAIVRAGKRKCTTQIYSFPEYDPSTHNYKEICKRLGIRSKDDLLLTYPAMNTFAPMDHAALDQFEFSLTAALPKDFRDLLLRFGAFHLPGDAEIRIGTPDSMISFTLGAWGFADAATVPVLAISPYSLDCDGDAIGYVRGDSKFGAELFRFHHDLRHGATKVEEWSTVLAPSLAEFIVTYLE